MRATFLFAPHIDAYAPAYYAFAAEAPTFRRRANTAAIERFDRRRLRAKQCAPHRAAARCRRPWRVDRQRKSRWRNVATLDATLTLCHQQAKLAKDNEMPWKKLISSAGASFYFNVSPETNHYFARRDTNMLGGFNEMRHLTLRHTTVKQWRRRFTLDEQFAIDAYQGIFHYFRSRSSPPHITDISC